MSVQEVPSIQPLLYSTLNISHQLAPTINVLLMNHASTKYQVATFWERAAHSVDNIFYLYFDYLLF